MKRLLLLCALAIPCFMACEKMDEAVSPDVEQQQDPVQSYVMRVAEEGIAMLGDADTRAVRRRIDPNRIKPCITTATRSGESDTLYYVVNFADSAGFALVAADSTSPAPLLAVTEQGNYTPGEVTNTGFDDYISLLADNTGGGNIVIPDTLILERDTTSLIIVDTLIVDTYSDWMSRGPYIHVQWGQGSTPSFNPGRPYNQFCHNNQNEYFHSGCTPVAMAQIMTYHRFPPYYYLTFQGNTVRSVNWDLMNSSIGGLYYQWNQTAADNVSYLMREIGYRANTNYTPNGSYTDNDKVVSTFSSFGYASNHFRPYAYYEIKSEMDASRPILMVGWSSNGGGHTWVVDGYKSRSLCQQMIYVYSDNRQEVVTETTFYYRYLHMNWGYDGKNNGYFSDGVFNLNSGYSYDGISVPYDSTYNFQNSVVYVGGIKVNNVN